MKCPYCQKDAEWTSNEVIYGRRYGKSWMCYWCKDCDSYVGCHQNTRQALGMMANKELRQLRMKCHALFDPLWKEGSMSRKSAYHFLKKGTGIKHIGGANEKDCQKIITFLTP